MHTTKVIVSFTAIIASSLMSCASITESKLSQSLQTPNSSNTEAQQPQPELTPDSTSMVSDKSSPTSETILNEVISRQKSLEVCNFNFDAEAAREFSQVYTNDKGQHLVQLLCVQAAYQNAFTFLQVDTTQPELKIKPLEIEVVGFPQFDPKTKILSNAYKFTGAGICIQETQHYWNGDGLRLVSSQLIEQGPNGCQEAGGRSPSAEQLITTKNVGAAKLGMSLGELKQVLGEGATFAPTPLGVDAGEGIKVTQDGNLQYLLGFGEGKQPITNNSQITMITVANPNYTTTAGVGPGTPLKEAIAAYGQATLSYNLNNETREYIKFERGLGADKGVLIRSNQWTITDFAGIYSDPQSEFNETQKYQDHAAIGSITIRQ
ncbi:MULTISPECIES: DUF1176 domain-containing protein [unclassified Nodularia (in: cyanobacteria)]|uniref:DUF1176 domain-containing protein n=1 Tax=unclassified Nodularia (in: cyanobacteria) TaxID=2656917 RepID=UPI0018820D0F|nr:MULTISPECIES: DUF1176 domain-containing protein [unclassified Nodularia (in: cyanobacteria)]MBE9199709.1 DUF1176 domain-containing protein [Nodularia sp. LEGE 06071]MCC2692180.1 DUF1176 domain-containing protein [Nodularia sp. LEGE 04288]